MRLPVEPIRIEPRVSLYLRFWLFVVSLTGLWAIWLLQADLAVKLLLALVLMLYLLLQLKRHVWRNDERAVVAAVSNPDGGWHLSLGNGMELDASLDLDSFVHPWLIVLVFKPLPKGRRLSLILPRDSLEPEIARKLRVWLRTHPHR